jgi:hypothetical protein
MVDGSLSKHRSKSPAARIAEISRVGAGAVGTLCVGLF